MNTKNDVWEWGTPLNLREHYIQVGKDRIPNPPMRLPEITDMENSVHIIDDRQLKFTKLSESKPHFLFNGKYFHWPPK